MIKIKSQIDFLEKDGIIRVFLFDKRHEENFEILYKIVQEKANRKKKMELNDILILWSFMILREIRNNTLGKKPHEMFSDKSQVAELVVGIREISFEVLIDDFPKKIIHVPIAL